MAVQMCKYAVHADYAHVCKYEDAAEKLIHINHIYMFLLICCKLVQAEFYEKFQLDFISLIQRYICTRNTVKFLNKDFIKSV